MDLEKKDWAIILLAVLAVASIAGNGVLLFLPSAVAPPDLGVRGIALHQTYTIKFVKHYLCII